ncbi:MAG: hypothetical protein IPF47_19585 [Gemmatimonadetes bacterium]|nr:hypothetical protein [Gemmatimonadota bacterium]
MKSLRFLALAFAAGLLAACGGEGVVTPPAVIAPPSLASAAATPTFLPSDPTAPAIANPVISFWAKRGVDQTVFMYYASRPGASDSSVFLRFRVRKRSLAFYPNGQPFANGDSVQITLTLSDAVNRIVDFQPSGLVFNSGNPADLKISYLEADDDYNQDGVVNGADTRLERTFRIWKLHASNPWAPQTSIVSRSLDEVETKVYNFTSYAIAY